MYDGSKSDWREEEAGHPVNIYGKTKLEAEQVIQVQTFWILPGCSCPWSRRIYEFLGAHIPCTKALFCQNLLMKTAFLPMTWTPFLGMCNILSTGQQRDGKSVLLEQERWPNHVILRSSIIYGPQSPTPVARPLFLQFVARQLAEGTPTSFFNDEFRNPVFVDDIVRVVLKLLEPRTAVSGRWVCVL